MKVLVVENNESSLNLLADLLEKEGLDCIKAQSGTEALEHYRISKPDFICLDIMMDDMSGYDVCKNIRKDDDKTPIIFISSKSETIDKVLGLEIGADDYIVKPFDFSEVSARIRAVMRRCLNENKQEDEESDEFTIGDLIIHPSELKATRGETSIDLSLRDVKILNLLSTKQNQVIDRETLQKHCWGPHISPESRTIDQTISQLRQRVEIDAANPKIITTVHGAGYRYMASEHE